MAQAARCLDNTDVPIDGNPATSTQTSGVTLIAGTADTNGSNNLVKFVDNNTANQDGVAIVTVDGTTRAFRGLALSPHP